jgi:hypothetical protein
MARLEQDAQTGIFKVGVRIADGRLKRSLQTSDRKEAEAICGTVETTLTAIKRGWVVVPGVMTVHERKRSQAMRTTRRVPLSLFCRVSFANGLQNIPAAIPRFARAESFAAVGTIPAEWGR